MDAIASLPNSIIDFSPSVSRPPLRVLLASPRGFCAGVVRAVEAVESALLKYGAPVYVRRPIVHNMEVVRSLEAKGAIFIEELEAAPAGAVVILSAHGVAEEVVADGKSRGLQLVDAICPLVAKVHREIRRHHADSRHILLIGHAGHPEIIGSMGQVPAGSVTLIGQLADVEVIDVPPGRKLAYAVQTTFSVEEAEEIVSALEQRFGELVGPPSADICYATSNRQNAVREIAAHVDAVIVAGERFSSNARRLVEVARSAGCPAQLVASAQEIDWSQLTDAATIGVSSAASTPESTVEAVLAALRCRYAVELVDIVSAQERITFRSVEL